MALNLTAVTTRARYATTSDFPSILATVGRTTLTQGYALAPRTFQAWTRRTTLPDFRTASRVSLGTGPQLLEVPEHGEYTRGTIGARAEPLTLRKFGKMLAFTREALVNDDIGLFLRIPQLFGASAAQVEGDVVYGILTSNPLMSDGFALFSTEHGKLLPPGPLNLTTLNAARQAMRTQRSAEGATLNLEPVYLIVGPFLETAALQILNGTFVPTTVEATIPAPMRTLQLVVDLRITDASWYLAASPNQVDTLEYAYLDGAPEGGPALESQPGWNVDGVGFRARMEFGAAAIDWRGLNKTPAA